MKFKDKITILTYNFLINLATPFYILILIGRFLAGRENKKSMIERLVIHVQKFDPDKKYIWINGACVGELSSIFRLIKQIMEEDNEINILFTSNSFNAAEIIKKKFPEKVIFRILPVDNIFFVRRFLKNFRPILCLWIESEFWYNYLNEISKKCKILLMNARMSDVTFKEWKYYENFIRIMLTKFDMIYPQSKADFEKYKYFGVREEKTKFLGNMKLTSKFNFNDLILNDINSKIIGKKIFVAASTHEPEEEEIVKIFDNLKLKYQNLILILVPKNITTCSEIAKNLSEKGAKIKLRSEGEIDISKIYIIDNFGELVKFYNIADVIFLGRTLGKRRGGHNPLEPIKLGKFIFTGPYMGNFKDLTEQLVNLKAMKQVDNWKELEEEIDKFLSTGKENKLSDKIITNIENITEITYQLYIREIREYLINS